MKLIDEVAALSSVEALEALCPAYIGDGQWVAINQNLGALRQQLESDPAACQHGVRKPHACGLCEEQPSDEEIDEFMQGIEHQRMSEPVAWRIRYQHPGREVWGDWRLGEWKPRERASMKTEIEPLYKHPAPAAANSARKQDPELVAWLRERQDNCLRMARGKSGEDAAGWLEDADYFKRAVESLQAA